MSFSDLSHVQNTIGIIKRPTLYALVLRDFVHDNADEASRTAGFGQQLG